MPGDTSRRPCGSGRSRSGSGRRVPGEKYSPAMSAASCACAGLLQLAGRAGIGRLWGWTSSKLGSVLSELLPVMMDISAAVVDGVLPPEYLDALICTASSPAYSAPRESPASSQAAAAGSTGGGPLYFSIPRYVAPSPDPMALEHSATNGVRPGTLVEVNGLIGQLVSYAGEGNRCTVALTNGGEIIVDAQAMQVPQDLKKPGQGGGEDSFDLLLGPRTASETLAAEAAACLFEKGFCVLKVCQDLKEQEQMLESVKGMGDSGLLGRLPEEVEEGYLGTHGKGKVAWLDPDDPSFFHDELLETCNQRLSHLAALLQPFSEDALGKVIEERTPALVSLSLQEDEGADYPFPMADDKTLGDFLGTWRRGRLRAVHFLGPETASVSLDRRDGPAAAALPVSEEIVPIAASPCTLILFRPECYSLECIAEGEVLSMMASFLAPGPQFTLTGWEGDPKALRALTGSSEPAGDRISVLTTSTRLGGCWDEAEMFMAGLRAGCDTSAEIPFARFDVLFYYCHDPDELNFGPPRTVQKHTSYIEGINLFDNKYFEISSNEAVAMDPLQRQVLEVGGTCLYAHGITKKISNRNSHHGGCSVGLDKADFATLDIYTGGSSAGNNALAIAANRFSFVFNLKGPNYICDTACSASLTATHLAKLAILERVWDPLEFHVAIGTHACLAIGPWIGTSMSHMVSPQGRCFSFSAAANGYLRGEGTSGMLLKFCTEDDNSDCAIYRASQCGQDGRSATLTAPNGPAQEQIIERAIQEAKMTSPESSAWECHGTGTSLGDPIEVGAIKKIMLKKERPDALLMGTSKSNIGHLEGGAGMASMVKCVVQVLRCECQPTLHLGQLNPHLEHAVFDGVFDTEASPFRHSAGNSHVSSFGFGGSNGHVIFYGKGMQDLGSVKEQILRRLKNMSPPEVRPVGESPEEWESDLPEADVRPGDVYKIFMSSEDPPDAPLRWVRESRAAEDSALADTFYSITGNFNDWQDDRMEAGEVPGHHAVEVEVPESGLLEFRFLKDGDPNQALGPEVANCSQKLVPIIGPKDGFTHSWSLRADPGTEFRIELCAVRGSMGVLWFQKRST